MRVHTLLGALGIVAVAGTFLCSARENTSPASPPPTPPEDIGHLILQVEGNVRALQVTHVSKKKSGYNRRWDTSPYTVDLHDAKGNRLGSYPLDLSRFETNPLEIGKPVRVEGCEVRDSKIVTLINLPYLPEATSADIRHGDKLLGRLGPQRYRQMLAAGVIR